MSKYEKFKQGMRNLSPAQILHAKMVGHAGGALGLVLATATLLIKGLWYFGVFMFFMIWLQVWEYISVSNQYNKAIEIQNSIKKIQDIKVNVGEN